MRILALSAILVAACGGRSSSSAPPSYRYLPAAPELAVRIDLVRARAWPHFAKAAELATNDVRLVLEAAQRQCELDVMGTATHLMLARTGPLVGGDLTLILGGLPRPKVESCLTTIAAAGSIVKPTIEGDLVHVEMGGRSLASGAFLPGGELVLVMRAGAGVAPEAWKAEVAKGGSAPAWIKDLHPTDPIAIRSATAERTVVASIVLADPLLIRGRLVAPSAEAATADAARARAILAYLEQGDTGTGRIEPKGETIHGDFTAKGAQIENLVAIALPALLGGGTPETPRDLAAEVTGPPGDCATLAPAVEQYIQEGLNRASPETREAMAAQVAGLIPRLQQVFVDTCKADGWAGPGIACHVQHATDLPKFEQCRQVLTAPQRERLDKALAAALGPPGTP